LAVPEVKITSSILFVTITSFKAKFKRHKSGGNPRVFAKN